MVSPGVCTSYLTTSAALVQSFGSTGPVARQTAVICLSRYLKRITNVTGHSSWHIMSLIGHSPWRCCRRILWLDNDVSARSLLYLCLPASSSSTRCCVRSSAIPGGVGFVARPLDHLRTSVEVYDQGRREVISHKTKWLSRRILLNYAALIYEQRQDPRGCALVQCLVKTTRLLSFSM